MKKRPSSRDYPRTARLNTLVREIIADELERIDDERLEFVTLTAVVVDGDLARAAVYYDHSRGEEADEEIAQAFTDQRKRLQGAVGRQDELGACFRRGGAGAQRGEHGGCSARGGDGDMDVVGLKDATKV